MDENREIPLLFSSQDQSTIDHVDAVCQELNLPHQSFKRLQQLLNYEDPSSVKAVIIDDKSYIEELQAIVGRLASHQFTVNVGYLNRENTSIENWDSLHSAGFDLVVDYPCDNETLKIFIEVLMRDKEVLEKDPSLEDFFKEYRQSIGQKLKEFENLINQVKSQKSSESVDALKKYAHKIAGSAGSYGYMRATKISKELELDMLNVLDNQLPVDEALLQRLDRYFAQLKLNFQITDPIQAHEDKPKAEKPAPQASKGIYLIGTDKGRISHLEEMAKSSGYALVEVHNFEELDENLQFHPALFTVVSHEMPENEEFLRGLKKREIKSVYIAPPHLSANQWERIKKNFQVAYILSGEISEELLQYLFKMLSGGIAKGEGDEYYRELRKEYEEKIPAKIHKLEELIQGVEKGGDIETLKGFLHKVSGSAGSYGYPQVSDLCKTAIKSIEESQQMDLWTLFDQLKLAFQLREVVQWGETPGITATPEEVQSIDIMIIDDDEDLLKQFQTYSEAAHVNIEVQSSPKTALESLEKRQNPPKYILIDKNFPEEMGMSGYDLIKQLSKDPKITEHSTIGVLTASNTMEDHIQAAALGVENFFQKPLVVSSVLDEIKNIVSRKLGMQFRVLLLDDDPDFCQFVIHALEEIDIKIQAIQDENQLYETIGEVIPNLLLLDLSLPNYSGVSLLRSLRADQHFHHLPVMVISGKHQEEEIKACYQMGIEDFVEKPLDKTMLQLRIQNLIKKKRIVEESKNLDPVTGLYNRGAFLSLCYSRLVVIETISVVLLKILPKGHDHLTNSDAQLAANKVREAFSKGDILGSWDFSHIAILLSGMVPHQAENLLHYFFNNLKKEQDALSFILKGEIFPYVGAAESLEELVERSIDEMEKDADTEEWGLNILITDINEVPEGKERNILIIDDDVDLVKMLTFAFEMRGCKVTTFDRGIPGLSYFMEHLFENSPDIVLLDFSLPDESGLNLIQKIREVVGLRIPIIMMSVYSKEQDITNGLNAGADEYIPKPFTLSALVERALGLIKS